MNNNEAAQVSNRTANMNVDNDKIKPSYRRQIFLSHLNSRKKLSFSYENEFLNGDMLNNNNVITVECADESPSDNELFNTSYVAPSLVLTENVSKSLNDIYTESIPQNAVRPSSLVFMTDELFSYVSKGFQ